MNLLQDALVQLVEKLLAAALPLIEAKVEELLMSAISNVAAKHGIEVNPPGTGTLHA